MYRPAARAALRSSQCSLAPARTAGRRYLTTEPPHVRSRTWKSSALRWGIAAAAIYYYNTSSVFAEYPQNNLLNPNVDALDDEKRHPTLDQLTASSRNKAQKDASTLQSVIEQTSDSAEVQRQENEQALSPSPIPGHSSDPMTGGAADLEAEAESEGAFNPVTGEINWDCPCLGGMAYGPCGDEFRAAFSCFVYSNEDPKGMECIDKFQGMQDCFRAHPEVYKGEIEDDEALDGELAEEKEQLQKEIQERRAQVEQRNLLDEPEPTSTDETTAAKKASKNKASSTSSSKKPAATSSQSSSSSDTPQPEAKTTSHTPEEYSLNKETKHGAPSQQVSEPQTPRNDANAVSETESLVPKAAHDARDSDPARSYSKAVDM